MVAVLGAVVLIGSFVWRSAVVPALVRYPTDLDVTPQYAGTVTLYIDPATHLPLSDPADLRPHRRPPPRRRWRSQLAGPGRRQGGLSTSWPPACSTSPSSTSTSWIAARCRTSPDPRAWAFTPDNVVDRAPDYRLNFPFDTKLQAYAVYKNETESTYQATPAGTTTRIAGITASDFDAHADPLPVSPAYLASLDAAVQLPRALTLDELKPILASAGFDIDASLPGLLAALSPEDVATVTALATSSVDLAFELSFTGTDSIDRYTGSTMDVRDVTETLVARPTGNAVSTLRDVLERYPDNTEAQAGLGAIASLDEHPIKVFANTYSQTPASIDDIAKTIADLHDRRHLAEVVVPMVLLIAGIVLLVGGVVLAVLPKRR